MAKIIIFSPFLGGRHFLPGTPLTTIIFEALVFALWPSQIVIHFTTDEQPQPLMTTIHRTNPPSSEMRLPGRRSLKLELCCGFEEEGLGTQGRTSGSGRLVLHDVYSEDPRIYTSTKGYEEEENHSLRHALLLYRYILCVYDKEWKNNNKNVEVLLVFASHLNTFTESILSQVRIFNRKVISSLKHWPSSYTFIFFFQSNSFFTSAWTPTDRLGNSPSLFSWRDILKLYAAILHVKWRTWTEPKIVGLRYNVVSIIIKTAIDRYKQREGWCVIKSLVTFIRRMPPRNKYIQTKIIDCI